MLPIVSERVAFQLDIENIRPGSEGAQLNNKVV